MKKLLNYLTSKNPFKNRKIVAVLLFVLTIGVFGFIGFRFTWIMVRGQVDGENLNRHVHNQYTEENVQQAQRGTIYDRDGNTIAVDATSYKLVAVLTDSWSTENKPIHVQDPEAVAEVLSKHIPISYDRAYNTLTKEASQVEFGIAGSNLSYDTVRKIEQELKQKDLTGIKFQESQTRLYPNGTFASHIVGLAENQTENEEMNSTNQLTGTMGIEKTMNSILTGKNGVIEYQKDSFGYAIPNSQAKENEVENGDNVYLTLNRRIQVHLENILSQVQEKHSPRSMTATVMDAESGEIIASSQRPSFNATTKEGINNGWENLLIQNEYEPGSTIKVMTLAAAIEEGVFNPNETFMSGRYETAGGVISDVEPEGWGEITYLEGLYRSSNIAFVKLVEKMGVDTWKSYLDAYGFEQTTGINLPNEKTGSNPYKSKLQKLNTSFGQGITVTPVQMLQGFSAIANDGQMVQPRIVNSVVDSETGEEKEIKPAKKGSPISKESAEKAREYLSMSVDSNISTTSLYDIEGYDVAAKTGTAEIVNPETGQYYQSAPNFIYSVSGMVPANDPQFIVYITVKQPELTEDAPYGGAVVEKIYHPLMNFVLDYYSSNNSNQGENTSNQNSENTQTTPDFTNMNTDEAVARIEEIGLDVGVIGSGETIVQQYPKPQTSNQGSQRTILMTNGAKSLPNMKSWSKQDVLKVGDLTGVEFKFQGEGQVTSQELPPGSTIEEGDQILIELGAVNENETNNQLHSQTQNRENN